MANGTGPGHKTDDVVRAVKLKHNNNSITVVFEDGDEIEPVVNNTFTTYKNIVIADEYASGCWHFSTFQEVTHRNYPLPLYPTRCAYTRRLPCPAG